MNRVASFLSEVDARVKLSALKRGIYDYYRGQNTGQITASSNLMHREPVLLSTGQNISSPDKKDVLQPSVVGPPPIPDPAPAPVPVPVKQEDESVAVQSKLADIAVRLNDSKGKKKELKHAEVREVLQEYTGLSDNVITKKSNEDSGGVTPDSGQITFRKHLVNLLPDPANPDSVLVQVGTRQYPATNGLMLLLLANRNVAPEKFVDLWDKSGITEDDKKAYVQISFDTIQQLKKDQKTPTNTPLERNFKFLGHFYQARNAVYSKVIERVLSPGKGRRKAIIEKKTVYLDPLGDPVDMGLFKDGLVDFTNVGAGLKRAMPKGINETKNDDYRSSKQSVSTSQNDETYIRNRIHLLLASRMAGNDSPQLAQEVRELIQKLKHQ